MIHIRPTIDDKHFVTARKFRAAATIANNKAGQEWHAEMLPDHFKKDAQKKYNYQRRTSKYLAWKKKKWASRRPLKNGQYIEGSGETDNVLTGDMRDLLTRTAVVRGYPTRVTVQMDGPRYITMRVYKSNQPKKLEEIQTTTPQERERLAKVMDDSLEHSAAAW